MGKGLNPSKDGKHVAYAAGTGVLVFLDLVAHLILREVAAAGGPDVLGPFHKELGGVPSLPKEFSFELNSSFLDDKEAIGSELTEALESLDPEKKVF